MLHDRILVLVQYVTDVLAGKLTTQFLAFFILSFTEEKAPKDHTTLRSLAALIASLPASESKEFRKEFETVGIFGLMKPSYTDLPQPRNMKMYN